MLLYVTILFCVGVVIRQVYSSSKQVETAAGQLSSIYQVPIPRPPLIPTNVEETPMPEPHVGGYREAPPQHVHFRAELP
jgi:hypothetical protein